MEFHVKNIAYIIPINTVTPKNINCLLAISNKPLILVVLICSCYKDLPEISVIKHHQRRISNLTYKLNARGLLFQKSQAPRVPAS